MIKLPVNQKEFCGNDLANNLVDFFRVASNEEKERFVAEMFRRRNDLKVGARLAFFDFLRELGKQSNDEHSVVSEAARAAVAELRKMGGSRL